MMTDYFTDPVTLGCLLAGVALAAWALGRWQAAATGLDVGRTVLLQAQSEQAGPMPAAAPPPCLEQAREERMRAFENTQSLNDLHDEISAYRRSEKVFTTIAPDDLLPDQLSAAGACHCRYIGLIGRPTCPAPASARQASGCGQGCGKSVCGSRFSRAPAISNRPRQPSAEASFTRV